MARSSVQHIAGTGSYVGTYDATASGIDKLSLILAKCEYTTAEFWHEMHVLRGEEGFALFLAVQTRLSLPRTFMLWLQI